MDVYNIKGGGTFEAPLGAEAIVISSNHGTNITAQSADAVNPQPVLVIGAAHSDTINLAGAGTVIGGGGNDSILGVSQGTGAVSAITGSGNDTIRVLAGEGSVAAGDGNDNIALRGDGSAPGSGFVDAGGGNDTIRVSGAVTVNAGGGNDSISVFQPANAYIDVGAGSDTVFVSSGDATVVNQIGGRTSLELDFNTGNVRFVGSGNDTITLGSGNDTIIEAGSATVKGGTGHSTIQAGAGEFRFTGVSGIDSVTAGSGSATMIAGIGNTVFMAGSGSASMRGGGGNVTMAGGSGNETMVAGSKASLFSFDSAHGGGTTIISGFKDSTVPGVKSTKLEFKGYGSPGDILAHSRAEGGNTIISLDDGTTIFLKDFNFSKFGPDDIKS
jgi:Ca2+-binding RTX toxin-like protein